jgi:hypothetical protein
VNTYAEARCSLYAEIMWLYMKELLPVPPPGTLQPSCPYLLSYRAPHPLQPRLSAAPKVPSPPSTIGPGRCPQAPMSNQPPPHNNPRNLTWDNNHQLTTCPPPSPRCTDRPSTSAHPNPRPCRIPEFPTVRRRPHCEEDFMFPQGASKIMHGGITKV